MCTSDSSAEGRRTTIILFIPSKSASSGQAGRQATIASYLFIYLLFPTLPPSIPSVFISVPCLSVYQSISSYILSIHTPQPHNSKIHFTIQLVVVIVSPPVDA